jgi:hypothetical protein
LYDRTDDATGLGGIERIMVYTRSHFVAVSPGLALTSRRREVELDTGRSPDTMIAEWRLISGA